MLATPFFKTDCLEVESVENLYEVPEQRLEVVEVFRYELLYSYVTLRRLNGQMELHYFFGTI